MRIFGRSRGWLLAAGLVALACLQTVGGAVDAAQPAGDDEIEFSRAFLGIYRKMMEIERPILDACKKHDLNPLLAKAVCLYESGGNANLTSWAGAQGYFQVMPRTFSSMGVQTNIEAGIKYLALQYKAFAREDYAVAAYNGGPANLERNRSLRLETVQYVIGVGDFRSLLYNHEAEIRARAAPLLLHTVAEGEDWWSLSRTMGLPMVELRMYNPFLAHRTLKKGQLIAHPAQSEGIENLFEVEGENVVYTSRPGDNYFHVAFIFDADLDVFRQDNFIWRVQALPPLTRLLIQPKPAATRIMHTVAPGESIAGIAELWESDPWTVVRYNRLWVQADPAPGTVVAIPKGGTPRKERTPSHVTHRIRKGESLSSIARRYGVTVNQIQQANGMSPLNTQIITGRQLKIPQQG
jgi:LysM repeat protein